ncbi:MAG: pyridoxamine 5-phosphate oxidase-related FMN-binding [Ilumatobacteraceae bacterium]|nr:pyridoxamine 5-phosphate oxidase-related FMN-binding [Ilumatobacteraceae bacterium]
MLDPKIRDFAQAKNYGTISFHLADGSIGTHVMWVHADDEHILINTEVHRAKYKAVQANPKVTVVVWDNANPYAYAEVRGTVTSEVRGPDALASINALSQKYSGTEYPGEIQSERVILQITPDRQRSQGI